jgi:hypothetical protein
MMDTPASNLRCLPLLAFALAVGAGFLDWHLAVTVTVAGMLGFALAMPRNAFIVAAVLVSPLALLAMVVSTATWHWSLFGMLPPLPGDAALALPIGLVLAGAAACSLIPYAAARWSRYGIVVSFFSWSCGVLVTVVAAVLAYHLESTKETPFRSAQTDNAVRAMHYMWWTVYNGLTQEVAHFRYDGTVDMPNCTGMHYYEFSMRIPVESRKQVEQFTEPLPVALRKWFKEGETLDEAENSFFGCSYTVNEDASDGIVEVVGKCGPRNQTGLEKLLRDHPLKGFDIDLPTVHFQAPALIPGAGSLMTITAPRGCVASTFPSAEPITHDKTSETLTLPVGFPRAGFSPTEARRLGSPPWTVHVDLLDPTLQGPAIGELLRTLNQPGGIAFLFLISAAAVRGVAKQVFRWVFGGNWARKLVESVRVHLASLPRPTLAFANFYARRGRMFRWAIIAAICIIGACFLLPYLLLGGIIFLFDPTYWVAGLSIVVVLCLIEIIAFAIRRSAPRRV